MERKQYILTLMMFTIKTSQHTHANDRLRWASHVARTQSTHMPRILLEAKMYSQKDQVRPRFKWINDVQQDTERIGTTTWFFKAQDRTRWRQIGKQAIAQPGM